MLTVVTGGSGSGKSAFAEQLCMQSEASRRYYIATMEAFDEESRQRVKRHRSMRRNKGFLTVEAPTHVETLKFPADSCVLLECLSNLAANEMFSADGRKQHIAECLLFSVEALKSQAKDTVVVTNQVFSDGETYDKMTMRYLSVLGEVNRRLAQDADRVYHVVCGIPVRLK